MTTSVLIELAELLEPAKHLTDFAIESLDLEVVVGEIAADVLRVGQKGRNGYRSGVEAAGGARSPLVRPMRVLAAEPEGKRLPVAACREKGLEVRERRPRRIPAAPARLEAAGAPALTREADVVARRFEQVRIGREACRQKAMEHRSLLEPMRVLTGEQRRAGRRAGWRRRERMREQHALPGHPIEHGRSDRPVAVHGRVRVRPVVRDRQQDVGAPGCRLPSRDGSPAMQDHADEIRRQQRDEERAPTLHEQNSYE